MAEETYLQYLARMNGGKIPANASSALLHAGALNSAQRNLDGSYLTYDQARQATKQGVNSADMMRKKARWKGDRWKGESGEADYVAPDFTQGWGDAFSRMMNQSKFGGGKDMVYGDPYQGQPGVGSDGNVQSPTPPNEPGNNTGMGVPPPAGQVVNPPTWGRGNPLPPPPPPGTGTGAPPPRTGTTPAPPGAPGAPGTPGTAGVPPRNPVTTAPGPYTQGPVGPAPYAPGPMTSFDPTRMLTALRQATNYGQIRGDNGVQNRIWDWIAQSQHGRKAGQPGGPSGQ